MKVNEAPEKVYISPKVFNIGVYVTKVLTTKYEDNIEYTRTDAFIEKAEKYLKSQFIKEVSVLAGGAVNINFSVAIENFVNYMKRE